ncbi:MAG: hypothetical protein IT440_04030 [Phycisphaeraceae bacterium]|nr:hypothetical protein [Phycisphaeraceae bacterium]
MPYTLVSDADKEQLWNDYRAGKPTRVPVILATNPRVICMNPANNPNHLDANVAANDAKMHVQLCLEHQLYVRRVLGRYTDWPTDLPDHWDIGQTNYNVIDAACLGAEVDYSPGQLPDTRPFLTDDNKWDIFKLDISDPLQCDYLRDRMSFWKEMEKVCEGLTFEGRPVKLGPLALMGTDGPLTVCCNIRGATEFLTDLMVDPEYADKLLEFVTSAAINRREAFKRYWGDKVGSGYWIADDSCAMLSVEMYRDRILRHHQHWFNTLPPQKDAIRLMHLCGDSTRHFVTMRDELEIRAFDTGFPVNHGDLRKQLGPEIEIQGGPEVALLLSGTPDAVYRRATDILRSGVMEGGKFILREGNNLPPCVPDVNLEALYAACLDNGRYA